MYLFSFHFWCGPQSQQKQGVMNPKFQGLYGQLEFLNAKYCSHIIVSPRWQIVTSVSLEKNY
jgi:hypothetical protein